MNSRALLVIGGVLLGAVLLLPAAMAQEPVPAEQAGTEAQGDEADKKLPFALYVEVGWGSGSADEINSSIETSVSETAQSTVDLDEHDFARAAIGWKLPYGRGDFRVVFNGFRETGYEFSATGRQAQLGPGSPTNVEFDGNPVWWSIDVRDGDFVARRTPPQWTAPTVGPFGEVVDPGDDADGDMQVDPGEVRYPDPADRVISRQITDSLQHEIQTWDLYYGRSWGKRRFSAKWWGGLRYYEYAGNVPAAAWVLPAQAGVGFTDGAGIRLFNFFVEADGYGPSGSVEMDFNFFDQRLTLFALAQAAFLFSDIASDSGDFFTLVGVGDQEYNAVAGRVTASREKSTWQDSLELGVRYKLKSGVQFEAAVSRSGYLDVILAPTQLRIPQTAAEGPQGTSALYNTQDYVMDAVRFGVSFQF